MVAQAKSDRGAKVGQSRFIDRLCFTSKEGLGKVLSVGNKLAMLLGKGEVAVAMDEVGGFGEALRKSGSA